MIGVLRTRFGKGGVITARNNINTYDDVVQFHGHSCPGSALGFRVALEALKWLNAAHAEDEVIVAIVENDSCAVDAIQVMTGCTFGKGNLIFKDVGKRAYTFCDRRTGNCVRIVENYKQFESPHLQELRKAVFGGTASEKQKEEWRDFFRKSIDDILSAPADRVLSIAEAKTEIPPRARLFESLICGRCGECVMEPRAVKIGSGIYCADCAHILRGSSI
jgi:formylmethanofuran dehydrogenase subunit E